MQLRLDDAQKGVAARRIMQGSRPSASLATHNELTIERFEVGDVFKASKELEFVHIDVR